LNHQGHQGLQEINIIKLRVLGALGVLVVQTPKSLVRLLVQKKVAILENYPMTFTFVDSNLK
jgi:hypothetical protein